MRCFTFFIYNIGLLHVLVYTYIACIGVGQSFVTLVLSSFDMLYDHCPFCEIFDKLKSSSILDNPPSGSIPITCIVLFTYIYIN